MTFAEQKYGAKIEDFRIIIGPHIHSCCYKVDEEREQYFNQNFAKDSCKNGMLSLEKANLYVLEKIGVEGKILPRKITGTKAIYQRELATAIKRARHMALLPFAKEL